jgi:hypothetical protein
MTAGHRHKSGVLKGHDLAWQQRVATTMATIDRTAAPSRLHLAAAVAAAALAALQAQSGLTQALAQAPDTPAGIVAAQIRAQGYACTGPVAATRDRRASRPNGAVWTLRCRNASYRVRLVPDMAAEVARIE